MKNIIIGTAGHVDHGKTEIVKALTGRDTDRLGEEKARGISIVLGFAPLDLSGELRAGVVDVPGHERFVKNMVSGAVGVDLALMVVAADEGVMPQTIEHFEVLRLLGVERAVIAVTKTDLVDREMIEIVESDIEDLVEGSKLEDAPVVRTSAVTGEGIEQLREILAREASMVAERKGGGYFRMPVDRVFSRSGIGTIVTGTTWSGTVRKGDELVVEPGSKKIRIRDVHNFETALEQAGTGMRTALALHGVKRGEIHPGCQIISPGVTLPSNIADAAVEVSGIPGSALVNRQRVRVHHAAAELLARVVLLDSKGLGEGDSGLVQIRFEKPIVAVAGDRFVIRSYSPMRVIAGGRILDPAAPKSKRFDERTTGFLEVLDSGDSRAVVKALAGRAGYEGVSSERLRLFSVEGDGGQAVVEDLLGSGELRRVKDRLVDSAAAEELSRAMTAALERHAASEPLVWGIERERLRMESGAGRSPLFDHLLEEMEKRGQVFFRGGMVRAGSDEMDLSGDDRNNIAAIAARFDEDGLKFPMKQDFLAMIGDAGLLSRYLHILQHEGRIVRIAEEVYAGAGAIGDMRRALAAMFEKSESMSVGQFKEEFGLSRKYAVPLLEYLDREGFTVRRGDLRTAGPAMDGGPG